MDFRGLNRHEQRRLDDIERHLLEEAPEVVAAFQTAPVPSPDHGSRMVLVVLAALMAVVGLFADAPLLVVCSMAGATTALLAPSPRPRSGVASAGQSWGAAPPVA
ncbi:MULTISPECIES: DUF3040 domain-containing protein [Actinokineospora]|uniref:DUF3040 domain-containing protein n=1 Tax=Actinokineospora fastidiosa TaxID=1816 RepID=A0A918GSY4_9PSEU|nr:MULTISPECIES: DUF3040 domain-containing protein [Actinokineospora]UVS81522.1 hypothetical protein Actkin_05280 [Actinokineospora sp. UTMC 2448]GGS57501.1 hypothetical protein GCM10010171_60560 [Actinokineospora fastidiosa]